MKLYLAGALIFLAGCNGQVPSPSERATQFGESNHLAQSPYKLIDLPSRYPAGYTGPKSTKQTIYIEPTQENIVSIPVKDIRPNWSRATLLTEELFPDKSALKGYLPSDSLLEKQGDFDRDGKIEKAIIGTYRTIDDKFGSFLLILEPIGPESWRVEYVDNEESVAGVSFLWPEDGIAWRTHEENTRYYRSEKPNNYAWQYLDDN
jgi:hypothetical protein